MNKPIRIQLSRRRGWRMPANTVKVTRPGFYGNPFRVGEKVYGRTIDAQRAVDLFEIGIGPAFTARAKRELRGKNLACWCKLPKPGEPDICHAAVLLKIANQ